MQAQPHLEPIDKRAYRWALPILLLVTFITAALGAAASVDAAKFYAELVKPVWAPPAGVFGPVWTVLYSMMAASAWLVVRARGWRGAVLPLTAYLIQLGCNALWSWLFFYWHAGLAALNEIALLWLSIAFTMLLFWRVRPLAGMLLVPYLLWASFAAALTYTVCKLNPLLL